ncbi:MAG: hypothetical protein JWN48_3711 [Myxococcaceae bacterium]|nr:hypothetical protein [Myxococcaceae bacterium]
MHAVSSIPPAGGAPFHAGLQRAPCVDVVRQKVGWAELRREDLTLIEGGRVMVLASALGPPRLWGYLLDSALDAFTDGYLRAPEGTLSSQLNHGMRMASHFVRTRIDALIERRGADVSLLAIAVEGPSLHVLGTGTVDAYLYRRKNLRRIGRTLSASDTQNQQAGPEGLFKGSVQLCVEHLEPADVLFAGSRAVCTTQVLQRLSVALEHDRTLPSAAIVSTLSGAASELGVGAASLALRIAATF